MKQCWFGPSQRHVAYHPATPATAIEVSFYRSGLHVIRVCDDCRESSQNGGLPVGRLYFELPNDGGD